MKFGVTGLTRLCLMIMSLIIMPLITMRLVLVVIVLMIIMVMPRMLIVFVIIVMLFVIIVVVVIVLGMLILFVILVMRVAMIMGVMIVVALVIPMPLMTLVILMPLMTFMTFMTFMILMTFMALFIFQRGHSIYNRTSSRSGKGKQLQRAFQCSHSRRDLCNILGPRGRIFKADNIGPRCMQLHRNLVAVKCDIQLSHPMLMGPHLPGLLRAQSAGRKKKHRSTRKSHHSIHPFGKLNYRQAEQVWQSP